MVPGGAKIQEMERMSRFWCGQRGGLGTMQGRQRGWGQREWGQRHEEQRLRAEALKTAERVGTLHICAAVWGKGASHH